jgi:hypothetical protein
MIRQCSKIENVFDKILLRNRELAGSTARQSSECQATGADFKSTSAYIRKVCDMTIARAESGQF